MRTATRKRGILAVGLLCQIVGGATSVSKAKEPDPMQVAICPRLVLDRDGRDKEAFARRVEEMFVNKTVTFIQES